MSELIPPASERDHRRGSLDAAFVLVQYGDYECPYCQAAHPVTEELRREAGDELCFVYRHFPLVQVHFRAEPAAEAAEAAAAQGRFWQMHDTLYENSPALERSDLLEYAAEVGLDLDRFRREVAEHAHIGRIREDVESGDRSGVRGTPAFFINGVRYRGSYDLESLREALMAAR